MKEIDIILYGFICSIMLFFGFVGLYVPLIEYFYSNLNVNSTHSPIFYYVCGLCGMIFFQLLYIIINDWYTKYKKELKVIQEKHIMDMIKKFNETLNR